MLQLLLQRNPSGGEVLLHQGGNWILHTNPCKILHTKHLSDVIPILTQIEQYVEKKGWYAIGFISYEASSAFDKAMPGKPGRVAVPLLWFALYEKSPQVVDLPTITHSASLDWQPNWDIKTYKKRFVAIKKAIARGDCYQVNLTLRLLTKVNHIEDIWNTFLQMIKGQNQYAAWIHSGENIIASASPELFFTRHQDHLYCQPIKGTVERGKTTLEDIQKAQWLRHSEKNRAENLMIVDMIRNDLGRIAKPGTVRVDNLFKTDALATLWQMSSGIRAETKANLVETLQALFPCASITGAPKVSAMHMIKHLEDTPRGVYTGTIAYLKPGKQWCFSVAIRTMTYHLNMGDLVYGAGGGIVWDSELKSEYHEALLKAKLLHHKK